MELSLYGIICIDYYIIYGIIFNLYIKVKGISNYSLRGEVESKQSMLRYEGKFRGYNIIIYNTFKIHLCAEFMFTVIM